MLLGTNVHHCNAIPRIWQVSSRHGSDPELFSSVGSMPISDDAA